MKAVSADLEQTLGNIITNSAIEVEEGTGKKGPVQLILRVTAPLPPDNAQTTVIYKIQLSKGMGSGGQAEGRQMSELEASLADAIAQNGGNPITIVMPDGLGEVKDVAGIVRNPKRAKVKKGQVKRQGDPKTDFALVNPKGQKIYFISAKGGRKPSSFNQWGGFTNVPPGQRKEFEDLAIAAANFIMQDREAAKRDGDPLRTYDFKKSNDGEIELRRIAVGEWPKGLVIAKPITDRMLKMKAVFGDDFGTTDPNTGRPNYGMDYVNITFQSPKETPLKLVADPEGQTQTWKIEGFIHVYGPSQVKGLSDDEIDDFIGEKMGDGYHPIFLLRRAEAGRTEGVYDPENAAVEMALGNVAKIPSAMNSVRFGIFPASNRAITHIASEDNTIVPVWRAAEALADPACLGWMCRKGAVGGEDGTEPPLTDKPFDDKIVKIKKPPEKIPSGRNFNKYKVKI